MFNPKRTDGGGAARNLPDPQTLLPNNVGDIFDLVSRAEHFPKEDCRKPPQIATGLMICARRKHSTLHPSSISKFPAQSWLMMMMILKRTFCLDESIIDEQTSQQFIKMIYKRMMGMFVEMNTDFFAEIRFHMGKLEDSWHLYSRSCQIPRDYQSRHQCEVSQFPAGSYSPLIHAYLCIVPFSSDDELSFPNEQAAFKIAIRCHLYPFLRGQKNMTKYEWRCFLEVMQLLMQTRKDTAIRCKNYMEYTDSFCDCPRSVIGMSMGIQSSSEEMAEYYEALEFLELVEPLLLLLERLICESNEANISFP